jgi:hypothetical protein
VSIVEWSEAMKNITGYSQEGDEFRPDPNWAEIVFELVEICCGGESSEDIAAERNRTGMPSSWRLTSQRT